jgi:hypothetical protein
VCVWFLFACFRLFAFQVIDFWLLFFLLSTSGNIAVHILVDRYYQSEQKKRDTTDIVKVKFQQKVIKVSQITSCPFVNIFPALVHTGGNGSSWWFGSY